jgi:ATP/maltotriose-dependent transcriptional regulator MalT
LLQGDNAAAELALAESIALYRALDVRPGLALSLADMAPVMAVGGNLDRARALAEEGLGVARAARFEWGIAWILRLLGFIALLAGDLPAARAYYEQGLEAARQVGDGWLVCLNLTLSARVALHQGDYGAAGSLAEEALGLSRALGAKGLAALVLHTLGDVARHAGDLRRAALRFREALALQKAIGQRRMMVSATLVGLASVAAAGGDPDGGRQAARLLGAVPSLLDALGDPMPPVTRPAYERVAAVLRAALGEDAFAAAWESGRALTLEQAVADAERFPLPEPPAAPTPPAPPPQPAEAYPAGLTAREVEVLRLVAQGLTSAQVAERLVVSTVTVSTHLRSIYGKIGVNNRGAAVRFAVEHGLA